MNKNILVALIVLFVVEIGVIVNVHGVSNSVKNLAIVIQSVQKGNKRAGATSVAGSSFSTGKIANVEVATGTSTFASLFNADPTDRFVTSTYCYFTNFRADSGAHVNGVTSDATSAFNTNLSTSTLRIIAATSTGSSLYYNGPGGIANGSNNMTATSSLNLLVDIALATSTNSGAGQNVVSNPNFFINRYSYTATTTAGLAATTGTYPVSQLPPIVSNSSVPVSATSTLFWPTNSYINFSAYANGGSVFLNAASSTMTNAATSTAGSCGVEYIPL